jgi:hypothetical protein
VSERVAQEIGEQLCEPWMVDPYGMSDVELGLYPTIGPDAPHLFDHLLQCRLERGICQPKSYASAETSAREIHDVVHDVRHPVDALQHQGDHGPGPVVERRLCEHASAGRHRSQGVAQVVSEHGDELLPDAGDFLFLTQVFFGLDQQLSGIQVTGDQLREQSKHSHGLLVVDQSWLGVDRAQGAEERAVLMNDRNGDIALEAVLERRVVVAIRTAGDVVDRDGIVRGPYLMADRGFEDEFTAFLEAEVDRVEDLARHPSVFGHRATATNAVARSGSSQIAGLVLKEKLGEGGIEDILVSLMTPEVRWP